MIFWAAFEFSMVSMANIFTGYITLPIFATLSCPTLSAFLFVLALDITRARKHVSRLAEGAREQTLTVEEYRETSEVIRRMHNDWNTPLLWITGIAVLNVAGMFAFMAQDHTNFENFHVAIKMDLLVFATMGKEVMLLYLFTNLARYVNDDADGLVTDVFQWELKPLLMPSEETNTQDEENAADPFVEETQRRLKRVELIKIQLFFVEKM